jgi:hypothetical protein
MAEAGQTIRTTSANAGMPGSTGAPQGGMGASGTGTGGAADAGDLKSIASDVASEIANTAAEQGRGLLQAATGTAAGFADQRKETAAQSIADLAASLRETGDNFEEQPSLKAFVGSAADGLEQLATGLRDRSFADLYADVEAVARRQPMTFGAGAAVAGFLLARFIKSSAEELSEINARNQAARAGGTRQAGAGGTRQTGAGAGSSGGTSGAAARG